MLSPYSVQRPRGLVGLAGQQRREEQLLGADGVHLLAHDALDVAQHLQAERQPGVDAGGDAADVAGPHEQPVARAPRRPPGPRAGFAGTGSTCAGPRVLLRRVRAGAPRTLRGYRSRGRRPHARFGVRVAFSAVRTIGACSGSRAQASRRSGPGPPSAAARRWASSAICTLAGWTATSRAALAQPATRAGPRVQQPCGAGELGDTGDEHAARAGPAAAAARSARTPAAGPGAACRRSGRGRPAPGGHASADALIQRIQPRAPPRWRLRPTRCYSSTVAKPPTSVKPTPR